MQNMLKGMAEMVLPVLSESQFLEKGVLTPDEFVSAGDELVFRCPSWAWSGGEAKSAKSYLPQSKQFLITRNVPSLCRAHTYAMQDAYEEVLETGQDGDGEEGWVATHTDRVVEDILDVVEEEEKSNVQHQTPLIQAVEHRAFVQDDIPDFADLEEDEDDAVADEVAHDGFISAIEANDNIVPTRTYDLTITYDKYYQTPRVWLFGYDENRSPLSSDSIMEDISAEHAHKTVTMEAHPHMGFHCVSIHPCKHASVMRSIVQRLLAAGKRPRVTTYMFWFLKIISAVLPTIDYDFTLDAST